MKTRLVCLLFYAGCTFLLASCSPRQTDVVRKPELVDPSSLLARVSMQGSRIRSLLGSGSVTFESPEMAGSAFFHISLRKPDSLLLKLEGPFGIDAGFFFLSRANFVMYNRFENTVTSGRPTASSIRRVIPFAMSNVEILDAFTGSFSLPAAGSAPLSQVVEDGQFHLTFPSTGNIAHYWIDPQTDLVTKYAVLDTTGQLIVEATGDRTIETDGLTLPRLITVSFPRDRRRVSIFYSSITLNPPELSFVYAVPEGAHLSSLRD
jgi:hypothetical protein